MNNFKDIKLPLNIKIIGLLFLLSLATGVFIGIFLGSLSWALGISWPNWMRISLISSSFVAIVVWITAIRILFGNLEKNKKENVTHTILFKETPNDKKIGVSTITTATNEQMKELSRLILKRGRRLNTSLLEDVFGNRKSGDKFRDEMIHLKFFQWKNPDNDKAGLLITKMGYAMLKAYSE